MGRVRPLGHVLGKGIVPFGYGMHGLQFGNGMHGLQFGKGMHGMQFGKGMYGLQFGNGMHGLQFGKGIIPFGYGRTAIFGTGIIPFGYGRVSPPMSVFGRGPGFFGRMWTRFKNWIRPVASKAFTKAKEEGPKLLKDLFLEGKDLVQKGTPISQLPRILGQKAIEKAKPIAMKFFKDEVVPSLKKPSVTKTTSAAPGWAKNVFQKPSTTTGWAKNVFQPKAQDKPPAASSWGFMQKPATKTGGRHSKKGKGKMQMPAWMGLTESERQARMAKYLEDTHIAESFGAGSKKKGGFVPGILAAINQGVKLHNLKKQLAGRGKNRKRKRPQISQIFGSGNKAQF
jgi:hypothetical protein